MRKKNRLLKEFKDTYPKLAELGAKIEVQHFIQDSDGNDIDLYRISVVHPVIFDLRLIPNKFEDIEVVSGYRPAVNQFEKMFWSDKFIFWDEYFDPARLRNIVVNNINQIRDVLQNPRLEINEILDALTGDYKTHKKKMTKYRDMRLKENKEQIDFFNKLLALTEKAYINSDVYKTYKEKNWGYSITSTNLEKNKPVIVGFNWGAGKDWPKKYSEPVRQKEYPFYDFNQIPKDELGSFVKLISMFYDYYPDGVTSVQTNYCFFRSEFAHEISSNDLKERCAPLFNKLIKFLEPKILIGFSSDLYKYFYNEKLIDPSGEKIIKYRSGKSYRSLRVYKGKVNLGDQKVDYCSLPHPNYPLRSDIRKEAWEYCFNDS